MSGRASSGPCSYSPPTLAGAHPGLLGFFFGKNEDGVGLVLRVLLRCTATRCGFLGGVGRHTPSEVSTTEVGGGDAVHRLLPLLLWLL